ncbi:response regulator [Candidatus Dependentiae bacterium]|nr:response regulator [Candidatus Dependentiae bacterium]
MKKESSSNQKVINFIENQKENIILKNIFRISLFQWILIFSLIVSLFIIFIGIYTLSSSREYIVKDAKIQSENLAHSINNNITNTFERIDHVLFSVINEVEKNIRITGKLDLNYINNVITFEKKFIPEAVAIRVTNSQGQLILGNTSANQSTNFSDRLFFSYLRDHTESRLFITKPFIGKITKRWIIALSRRYNHSDGSFGGIVTTALYIEHFQKLLSEFDPGISGMLTLRDSEGGFVARHPNVVKGKTLSVGDKTFSTELWEIIKSGVSKKTYFATAPFDETFRTLTYQRINVAPFFIVASVAEEDYLNNWYANRKVLIIIIASFLIIFWVSILILRHYWNERLNTAAKLRMTEEKLSNNLKLLSEIEKIGHVGGWEFNIDTMKQIWTDEVYKIHEIEPNFELTVDKGIGFYSPSSKAVIENAVKRAIEHYEPFNVELEIITAKGNSKWINAIGKSDIENRRVYGFFQDITEKKRTAEIIETSEKKYKNLFAYMLDGFAIHEIILDDKNYPIDYRFIEVNPAFEALTGLKANDIIGKKVTEVHPGIEKYNPDFIRIYGNVVLTGKPASFETYFEPQNHWYFISAFKTEKNQFAVIFVDISEQKKLEQQLIYSEKLSAVGQLAAGIAHEFNNILAINNCNAKLLSMLCSEIEGSKKNELLECVNTIIDSGKCGAEIVQNMMTIAKPQPPKKSLSLISDIIDNALKLQKQQLEIENIKIIKNYQLKLKDYYDVSQMQQVFLNLIINARHAMKNKGCGEIMISIEEMENDKIIYFRDNGRGMSRDIQKKIFTPFFTTKGAFANNDLGISGSGLGLSVSYQIIKNHNGTIRVESEEGKGTTFIIAMPIDKKIMNNAEDNKIQKNAEIGDVGKKLRILFVDDEPLFLKTVEKLFHKIGYENIYIAYSGKEAFEIIKKNELDLVFLDLLLPDMKGEKIYDEIRKLKKDIPIIFMSGQVELNGGILQKEKQAFAYIQKPFDIDKVKIILDTLPKI